MREKKGGTGQMRWMSLVKRCAEFLRSSRSDCARRFPTCKMHKEGVVTRRACFLNVDLKCKYLVAARANDECAITITARDELDASVAKLERGGDSGEAPCHHTPSSPPMDGGGGC